MDVCASLDFVAVLIFASRVPSLCEELGDLINYTFQARQDDYQVLCRSAPSIQTAVNHGFPWLVAFHELFSAFGVRPMAFI